jgi:hypothetical protein
MSLVPQAEHFGELLRQEFSQAANGGSFREVRLFRAMQKAILATAPHYLVEEFHGARSQVVFPACPPWTKTVARCELADLCIVWFRRHPQPSARITFLQAKRSNSSYSLCGPPVVHVNACFGGDSTQWYLLNKRPLFVGRFQAFQPPANLLKDALLPSVASYCVFHEPNPQKYSFFYASADVITASTPSRPGHVQLTVNSSEVVVKNNGLEEQKWACCPLIFGHALYSGTIGTPIDHLSVVSREDEAFRSSVRRWLASVLAAAVRTQQIGPVIQAFIGMFDVAAPEEPTTAPARSILFIQGDAETDRER